MGFRVGSFATVWSTEPAKTGAATSVKLSTSRKVKKTGSYETDFSGFCTFYGKAHEKAAKLRERDRIKIAECDVTNNYDKEKKITYVNYRVFDFEFPDESGNSAAKPRTKKAAVDDGEVDEDEELPF